MKSWKCIIMLHPTLQARLMNCEIWGFIRNATCGTYPQVIRGNLIGILHHYVTCLQDCKGQIKGSFTDYFNYSQNNGTQVAQSGLNLFTHNSVQMHRILLKMNKDYCNFTSWFRLFVHFKSCFIGSLIYLFFLLYKEGISMGLRLISKKSVHSVGFLENPLGRF